MDGIRRLVFPDFAVTSDEHRVLVEVVGYWTPEYLARKLALLERTTEPLILCIDEKHMVHLEVPRFIGSRIVTFKKRIDVTKLLAAVERVAGVRGAA